MKEQEIRSFTGLRGIAALYVALFHFKFYDFFDGRLRTIANHGYLSVDIFFVLSGFVIALVYQSMFKDGVSKDGFKKFVFRRFARIYPLYFCSLLVTLLYLLFIGDFSTDTPLSASGVITNFLMVQSWGFGHSYVLPSWSISTEWGAYLLFPFLALIILFKSPKLSIAMFIAAMIALVSLTLIPREITGIAHNRGPLGLWEGQTPFPMIRCVSEFILGMAAYRISRFEKFQTILEKQAVSILLAALIVILISVRNSDIFVVALLPFFIAGISSDKPLTAKILSFTPIHWLGVVSYSLYLTHEMTFWFMEPLRDYAALKGFEISKLVFISLQVTVSLIMAQITYMLIEKPGRSYLRHLLEPGKKVNPEPNPNLSAP